MEIKAEVKLENSSKRGDAAHRTEQLQHLFQNYAADHTRDLLAVLCTKRLQTLRLGSSYTTGGRKMDSRFTGTYHRTLAVLTITESCLSIDMKRVFYHEMGHAVDAALGVLKGVDSRKFYHYATHRSRLGDIFRKERDRCGHKNRFRYYAASACEVFAETYGCLRGQNPFAGYLDHNHFRVVYDDTVDAVNTMLAKAGLPPL